MITKQAVNVNFSKGVQTKTDPWQLQLGEFLALDNMVFTTGDRLTKRNGYASLTTLPDTSYTYLTTLNTNLTALGTSIAAYDNPNSTWVKKGSIQPLTLSTLSLIRNNLNQTQCDAAVAPNGLVCTVYSESNGSTTAYKYAIADSVTGQNIVQPTVIPSATASARVFLLPSLFVIVFTASSALEYIAIPINSPTTAPTANQTLASAYATETNMNWDGVV